MALGPKYYLWYLGPKTPLFGSLDPYREYYGCQGTVGGIGFIVGLTTPSPGLFSDK